MSVPKAAGIETEYGIMIWGSESFNPFMASQLVLNTYQRIGGPSIPTGMYFSAQTGEPQPDPNQPQSADELSDEVPPVEEPPSASATEASQIEVIQNVLYGLGSLMLSNGARFYIDHAHPEYCTPETLSPRQIVAADKAGERIVTRCITELNTNGGLPAGQKLVIYKNNSDQKGNSYGCHENYLLSMDLFENLLRRRSHLIYRYLLPFQVSRVVFVGAGKVGYENNTEPVAYQLSQRADFFEMLTGLQTTYRRPLFNLRDESHSDSDSFRRLHVILGDANLSEITTYLKVGTMQLVLHMIEDGFIRDDLTLTDPLRAFQQVSRDLTFQQPLELENGKQMTAVEIQEVYLGLAEKYLDEHGGTDDQWHLWQLWADVLDALADNDFDFLARRLDWAIKKTLLDRLISTHGTTWEAVNAWQKVIDTVQRAGTNFPGANDLARALAEHAGLDFADYAKQREIYFGLRRMDLEYHDIRHEGAEMGLFYKLQARGLVERLLTDDDIARSVEQPPDDTRAWLRGKTVERFASNIVGIDWSYVKLQQTGGSGLVYRLEFPNPLAGTASDLGDIWPQLRTPDELFAYFRDGA